MRLQTRSHPSARAVITASKLPTLRVRLELERSFRREQVVTLADELAKAGEGQARLDVTRKIRSAAQKLLVDIEDAIGRLDDGSYGTCQRCRGAVERERLEVVPSTRLCRRCHASTEAPGSFPFATPRSASMTGKSLLKSG